MHASNLLDRVNTIIYMYLTHNDSGQFLVRKIKDGAQLFSLPRKLKATGRHLPYGITQPPDTSERAPP